MTRDIEWRPVKVGLFGHIRNKNTKRNKWPLRVETIFEEKIQRKVETSEELVEAEGLIPVMGSLHVK